MSEYKKRLLGLELKKKKLELKYKDGSAIIGNINQEIDQVKEDLLKEDRESIEHTIEELLTHINVLKERQKLLETHVSAYNKELEQVTSLGMKINRLKRQLKTDEESFLLYRRKLEEARISDILDRDRVTSVKMLEPVVASGKPASPRKVLILIIGIIASLIFSIGLVFILDYFDQTIKTAQDIRRYLKTPCLGTVVEKV